MAPGFDAGMCSFPLPKNSPIRKDLDLLASTLFQFGHTRSILRKYFTVYDNCANSDNSEHATADSLDFLLNVFIVWAIGEAVSIGVLCLELIAKRWQNI